MKATMSKKEFQARYLRALEARACQWESESLSPGLTWSCGFSQNFVEAPVETATAL